MWKSIFVKVIRVVLLSLLLAQFTVSSAFAHDVPNARRAQVNMPLPESPKLPDPEPANSPTPELPNSPKSLEPISLHRHFFEKRSHAAQGYDMDAIKKFDDEVYGQDPN